MYKEYLISANNNIHKAYKCLYNYQKMFINKRKISLERREYVFNIKNSSEKIITSIQ